MPGKSNKTSPTKAASKSAAKNERKAPKRKGAKAGITFPIARCNTMFRRGRYADRVAVSAGVFTAAVMEYIISEICELAGNAAQENKKKTIQPRHIQLALGNDEELNKLVARTTISSGGVLPNVQGFLFGK